MTMTTFNAVKQAGASGRPFVLVGAEAGEYRVLRCSAVRGADLMGMTFTQKAVSGFALIGWEVYQWNDAEARMEAWR